MKPRDFACDYCRAKPGEHCTGTFYDWDRPKAQDGKLVPVTQPLNYYHTARIDAAFDDLSFSVAVS